MRVYFFFLKRYIYMSIPAKPFKFLNQQTNLPTSGFSTVTNSSILNQHYNQSSSLMCGISGAINSAIGDASAALSSLGSMASSAESVIGNAVSSVGSAISNIASGILGSLECSGGSGPSNPVPVMTAALGSAGNTNYGVSTALNGASILSGGAIGNTGSAGSYIQNPVTGIASSIFSPNNCGGMGSFLGGNGSNLLNNALNFGNNMFSQGQNANCYGQMSNIGAPSQSIMNSGMNILSSMGRGVASSVSGMSSNCLNSLLNNLNMLCNLGSPYMNGLGMNNMGFGCTSALSGLLGNAMGTGYNQVPNLCNEYRMLTGLTMTATQGGLPNVFGPLSAQVSNQSVINASGNTLFNYGVTNSSFPLIQELGNSSAVGAISAMTPNATSLIAQSYTNNLSMNSPQQGGIASTLDATFLQYNPNALSGSIGGVAIPNVSNLVVNNTPSASIINSTISSTLKPSTSVNSYNSIGSGLLGSSNPYGINNANASAVPLSPNNTLTSSVSTSTVNQTVTGLLSGGVNSAGFSTGGGTGSSSQVVGVLAPTGGTGASTGYTQISSTPSTSTVQSTMSNLLGGGVNSAGFSTGGGSAPTTAVGQTVTGLLGGGVNSAGFSTGGGAGTGFSSPHVGSNFSSGPSHFSTGGGAGTGFSSPVGKANTSLLNAYKNRAMNTPVNIADTINNPTAAPTALGNSSHMYMAMQAVSQVA
jgi:hypothetical protein